MAKRPCVDLIFVKLPVELDPKQLYCIAKIKNEEKYFIANRATKSPFCKEHFEIGSSSSDLKKFLSSDARKNDLCLICAKRKTKTTDPSGLKSSKTEIIDCEKEEENFKEYFNSFDAKRTDRNFLYSVVWSMKTYIMTLEQQEQLPTSECLLKYVYSGNQEHNNPPEYVYENESKILGSGNGLFTNKHIETGQEIGFYNGKVEFKDPDDSYTFHEAFVFGKPSFKMDFWVRGKSNENSVSWTARINHQWKWDLNILIPKDFVGMFANTRISKELIIYANRNIDENEELTIDYQNEFWKPNSTQIRLSRIEFLDEIPDYYLPFWDLRNSKNKHVYAFFQFLFGQTMPKTKSKVDDWDQIYLAFMQYYIYHLQQYPISTILLAKNSWEFIKNDLGNGLKKYDVEITNPREHNDFEYQREYYMISTASSLIGKYRLDFAVNNYKNEDMVAIFCVNFEPADEKSKEKYGTQYDPIVVESPRNENPPMEGKVFIDLTEEEESGKGEIQPRQDIDPSEEFWRQYMEEGEEEEELMNPEFFE